MQPLLLEPRGRLLMDSPPSNPPTSPKESWGMLLLLAPRLTLRAPWLLRTAPPAATGKTKLVFSQHLVLLQAKEGLPLACAPLAGAGGPAHCGEGGEGLRRGDGRGGVDEEGNGDLEEDEHGGEGCLEEESQRGGEHLH